MIAPVAVVIIIYDRKVMIFFTLEVKILSQWAWFSTSTRNVIGFGQNSAHPLLDRDGYRDQQLRREAA